MTIVYAPERIPGLIEYGQARPRFIPESLDDLAGPGVGVVDVPVAVYSTGTRSSFDLDDDEDLWELYQTVLRDGTPEQQSAWLNRELLCEKWQMIELQPIWLRRAWEAEFPELTLGG